MAKNTRAFCEMMNVAMAQCKTDSELVPIVRFALAQLDARQAKRKARPKANKAVEAKEAANRA